MYGYFNYKDELMHHGVLGMKWGVRRYQPYGKGGYVPKVKKKTENLIKTKGRMEDPSLSKTLHLQDNENSDYSLKRGTKLNSVQGIRTQNPVFSVFEIPMESKKYDERPGIKYTYLSEDKHDNSVYKGAFAKFLVLYRGADYVLEHKYETVKDLKMPSLKSRKEEFKNLINDKKYSKKAIQEMTKYRDVIISQGIGTDEYRERIKNVDFKNLNNQHHLDTAYDIFNHAMEFANSNVTTKEYINRMSKKYDAMMDDNNKGVYNEAHNPIIIFKANEYLNALGDSFITKDIFNENMKEITKYMNSKGKRVAL